MKKFLVVMSYLALASSLWAADFSLNPARDFGAIRRINPTDYDGKSIVREDGTGLSSDTAAAFRAALEVFSKAEAEPAGAVATHAALVSAHGATGAVVGTSNTQSLTNKTLTDASNHISGAVIDTGVVADANIASTIARDSEYIAADSAVLSAANASDALNLRLDGSRAMTGSLKFSGNYGILQSTSAGADSAKSFIAGGGSGSASRGALAVFCGNQHVGYPGQARYYTGNVEDGHHIFFTGDTVERMRLTYGGNVLIGTTTDDGVNKLQVNGDMKVSGRINLGDGGTLEDQSGQRTFMAAENNKFEILNEARTSWIGAFTASAWTRANAYMIWDSGNDGAGSGLDADTVPNATPASATATGTAGMIRYDANYIYICVAANTWKRVAISTW